MANRKGLSKKIRFEVFKRDKFTCQYCGRKAPDIVLFVDHIDPVAKGGDNDIINLITSCFDCNSGKSDRKLDDNSVIEKQRKQLELLQERREQIELILEWKKSLATFDNDVSEMIAEYINSKIKPLSLNETGTASVRDWLKKFSTEKILDGIDEAGKKYFKYENGELTKDSAELFLSKVPAVIAVKQMPPIKQKLAYIKGIARNRFGYWDDRKGSIILNNYVRALEDYGWTEEQLINDLENEVIPLTKDASNWSQWKNTLENWVDDINKWEKPTSKSAQRESLYQAQTINLEDLDISAYRSTSYAFDRIEALTHIGAAFPNFNSKTFKEEALLTLLQFVNQLEAAYAAAPGVEIVEDENYVSNFVTNCSLFEYFELPDWQVKNFGALHVLREKCEEIFEDMFSELYLPRTLYKRKDIEILFRLCRQYLE